MPKPSVKTPSRPSDKAASEHLAGGRPALHLSATRREEAITEFEQALICAAEAFYRFAGTLLGPVAREHNLSGQDCVILQQLVAAGRARRIGELLRFGNRDDVSNLQYSLRKLIKAGLVRQEKGASKRDTAYAVTPEGARVSARLVARRRELLVQPLGVVGDIERQLPSLTQALGMLTGMYDHGNRISAGRDDD